MRLNEFRSAAGLPRATGDLAGVEGRWLHSRYQAMNGKLGHSEDRSNAWYTTEGAKHTGNCCAAVGGAHAIDCWATAPYHATILLQPGRQSYGMSTFEQDGKVAATLECGWDWSAMQASGAYPVRWPGPGSTVPYTCYWGGESPDPLAGTGYSNPVGLPIVVMFDSARSFSDSHIRCDGVELEHFLRRSGTTTAFIIPRKPLARGNSYDVAITASGVTYRWSFTVGPKRASALSISAPDYAEDGNATLGFTVRTGGLPSAEQIRIERSLDGVHWQACSWGRTSAVSGTGTAAASLSAATYFRASYAGDDLSEPATSNAVRVEAIDDRAATAVHVDMPTGTLVGSVLTLHPWVEANGASIPWSSMVLERSVDGATWASVRSYEQVEIFGKPIITDTEGYYRLRYPGDSSYRPSASSAWKVGAVIIGPVPKTPHRLVVAPVTASSVRIGRAFGVSGTLLPRHSRGSRAIKVQAFRYENRRWVLRRTFSATSSGTTPDRFSAAVSLPASGTWRIRALAPADSAHAWGASSYVAAIAD